MQSLETPRGKCFATDRSKAVGPRVLINCLWCLSSIDQYIYALFASLFSCVGSLFSDCFFLWNFTTVYKFIFNFFWNFTAVCSITLIPFFSFFCEKRAYKAAYQVCMIIVIFSVVLIISKKNPTSQMITFSCQLLCFYR